MAQILYSQPFGRKVFKGASIKDAYMKACKWYASNVIAKDKLHNVQVEYIKDAKANTVTIVLYAVLSETDVKEQHCQCCKEMHRSFFINEDTHCDRCSAAGYQRRLEQKLSVKLSYYKELLGKILTEGEV